MTTLTFKINERSKAGKAFLDFSKNFLKKSKAISIVEEEEQSPYNPEFVKEIKEAEKRGHFTEIDPKNIWESLGLKWKRQQKKILPNIINPAIRQVSKR